VPTAQNIKKEGIMLRITSISVTSDPLLLRSFLAKRYAPTVEANRI
jgi:hypothetical protein